MEKNIRYKSQWNIAAISIGLFTFSILCWKNFMGSCGSIFMSRFQRGEVARERNVESTNALGYTMGVQTENQQMEVKTGITFGGIDQKISTIDSVWCDAVYKKSELSKVDTKLTYYVTSEFLSNQVIKGSENWLFFKDRTVIEDYEGTNRYTQNEMNYFLQVALKTQSEIEKKGIKFGILIAPNKENIYSEFMPDVYRHEDISSTDILVDYLSEKGINIISPKSELLLKHLEMQLYYSYDTHWNQLGAYIGVRKALAFWDIKMPEISERGIISKNLSDRYHYCGRDDLARIVGLLEVFNNEVEYEVEGTFLMDWDTFEMEQNGGEVSHFVNESAEKQASVLLVGDSYRASMIPALGEMFSDVYVIHRSDYSGELLNEIEIDYLIVEYVERHSRDIGAIDLLIR